MNKLKQLLIYFVIIFISFNLHAGASDDVSTNSEDFETSVFEDEIYDPLEGINRAVFGFNNVADRIILEPVAKGYKKLPSPVQTGISNFLSNLRTPLVAVNQLLQGQGGNAAESVSRFAVNTTAGVFGILLLVSPDTILQAERRANKLYMTDAFFFKHRMFIGVGLLAASAFMIRTYFAFPL